MKKFHISLPYAADETLWLQWEKPKDTYIVKLFPGLAERWPHRFRNFVFRSHEARAAEISEKILVRMIRRAHDYTKALGIIPAKLSWIEI